MLVLILGVALWAGAHLWKRLAPGSRAAWGEKGKGPVTLALLGSVVLMVVGYRGAEPVQLWYPPAFLTHVNNLLMLVAFYLFAASGMKTLVTRAVRHPQLTGFKTWAVAHLLVNGDLASVILFGGLLAWAVVSVILINRAQPAWEKPDQSSLGKEIGAGVGAVVVTGGVALIHIWLGYWPFGGA
ncbi:MAG: NnrU family protein [Paracoccaceae bacterium]|nr:MAG: NnrU family protein [Paracoccaceae bacterium]